MAARKKAPVENTCEHAQLTYNNGQLLCVGCGAKVA